ncbi:MAG: hypothetical protein HOC77_06450 [Chloroflexi bacterium]|jgi:hypothetical protein|nr:hypothetical protein [Chloroflexota bacterium]MBT4072556.1 hypothetical protein [Chloroflexota bacterium]MBT4514716.1 hypothetical protein [Chloroflexota bacterium]MBT6681289.1 hypothetical protein [Chloroflexota bacterium]
MADTDSATDNQDAPSTVRNSGERVSFTPPWLARLEQIPGWMVLPLAGVAMGWGLAVGWEISGSSTKTLALGVASVVGVVDAILVTIALSIAERYQRDSMDVGAKAHEFAEMYQRSVLMYPGAAEDLYGLDHEALYKLTKKVRSSTGARSLPKYDDWRETIDSGHNHAITVLNDMGQSAYFADPSTLAPASANIIVFERQAAPAMRSIGQLLIQADWMRERWRSATQITHTITILSATAAAAVVVALFNSVSGSLASSEARVITVGLLTGMSVWGLGELPRIVRTQFHTLEDHLERVWYSNEAGTKK